MNTTNSPEEPSFAAALDAYDHGLLDAYQDTYNLGEHWRSLVGLETYLCADAQFHQWLKRYPVEVIKNALTAAARKWSLTVPELTPDALRRYINGILHNSHRN